MSDDNTKNNSSKRILNRLKRLTELYSLGTIEENRYIIGSFFSEKWRILDFEGRTAITNPAARLTYLINKSLVHKKNRKNVPENYLSGFVLGINFNPYQLEEDLKIFCRIPIDSLEDSEN
ncbi:hypothetical protein [Pedobacter endophyticus]|uniref:Uncharacterized protein n=1 Tax=Pedobacter endophyticus TaxID=2789740 RepID=A0A7S9L0N0_9SPHI|nr:hypothetical protein [Pedobacter endophyticus]QPH40099.1 hypothetical protein IZT61_02090 [Pedobacter endophyticus]